MANIPSLDQLRKNPSVSVFHGARVVQCDLTGQLLTSYAAIPVPKVGKGGKSKTTFRGSFIDYETALAYLAVLQKRGDISTEQYDSIAAAVAAHLGFMPQRPTADPTMLTPFGPLSLGDWHSNYTHESATHPGSLFSVPEKKPEKEHKDKYWAYDATFEGGKCVVSDNIAASANNINYLLKPWGEEAAQAYSFLVTMDGARNGAEQIVVQEYPAPKGHSDAIGLKSAKNPKRCTVLRAQKPKAVAAKAAELVAQIDAAIADVAKPSKRAAKSAVVKKEEGTVVSKKRKAPTASA